MKYTINYSDQDIINNIKDNPYSAHNGIQEIIERHSGIYLEIVNNYIPDNLDFVNKNDILEDKNFNIYQAVLKYDPNKGAKFSTYLGNETKWMCLNLYNKNKKKKHTELKLDKIDQDFIYNDQEQTIKKELYKNILKLAKNHPDKRVYKIFHMRYEVGKNNKLMSWKDVAKKIKMSIQGCINIHNSAIKKFKQKLIKE